MSLRYHYRQRIVDTNNGSRSAILGSYPSLDFFNSPEKVDHSGCYRKAAEVSALLLPSSSIHSTSPVSRHTAE